MINLNIEQKEYIMNLLDMSLGSLEEVYEGDEEWINKKELDIERELIKSIQDELKQDLDYIDLYPFCEQEADYRVKEMDVDYEGYNYISEYLKAEGKDVDDFITDLALELYNNSEQWIDGEQICNIMYDLLDKEVS